MEKVGVAGKDRIYLPKETPLSQGSFEDTTSEVPKKHADGGSSSS
jgi:hypothetical protein